nr:recombinase family protein [uncultured Paracoccus sp.]
MSNPDADGTDVPRWILVRKRIVQRTALIAEPTLALAREVLSHINGTIIVSDRGGFADKVTGTFIGYARCSTDKQDLAAQQAALEALGVTADRVYVDHGLSGASRARPGLDQALAAVRAGDTLVVPKLDRLARSVPDARAIADQLLARGVTLQLGASAHDPHDPMGRMFFNILATFAEFEADLIRLRTREGMAVARAKGRLRGKQPKLSERQQKELVRMHATDNYSISDLAELFSVSRPTVYRTLQRQRNAR